MLGFETLIAPNVSSQLNMWEVGGGHEVDTNDLTLLDGAGDPVSEHQ